MEWKSSRHRFKFSLPLFYCLSIGFFSIFALIISTISTKTLCSDIRSPSGQRDDCYIQELEEVREKIEDQQNGVSLSLKRRYLSGPGSSPPRCTSKCGKCTPCKPVHVPVPPGTPVTTEYYPEAWRCKCGNKLYMP